MAGLSLLPAKVPKIRDITNVLPANGVFSRVMPEKFAKLLEKGESNLSAGSEAWISAADDLKGIETVKAAAQRLTLVNRNGGLRLDANAIVDLRLKTNSGIASPINRLDSGFVGGGRTAGGAREWIIPSNAEIEIIRIRSLR
jgi:hypothetical protein